MFIFKLDVDHVIAVSSWVQCKICRLLATHMEFQCVHHRVDNYNLLVITPKCFFCKNPHPVVHFRVGVGTFSSAARNVKLIYRIHLWLRNSRNLPSHVARCYICTSFIYFKHFYRLLLPVLNYDAILSRNQENVILNM